MKSATKFDIRRYNKINEECVTTLAKQGYIGGKEVGTAPHEKSAFAIEIGTLVTDPFASAIGRT